MHSSDSFNNICNIRISYKIDNNWMKKAMHFFRSGMHSLLIALEQSLKEQLI